MSSIGNRFYVTALEDGTTLHGNLVAERSLSQGWNGTTATPDWTNAEYQPTIYLTLLSGSTNVNVSSYTWKYNGTTIVFGNDDVSTTPSGLFKRTTKTVGSLNMPALKIIGNLAGLTENGAPNVDNDIITFEGTYNPGSGSLTFTCTAIIRITSIAEGSYLGVIEFANGISDITEKGQTLTLTGKLFQPNGEQVPSGVTTTWWLNDFSTAGTTAASFTVSESSVVDHAIVKCKFTYDNAERYVCFAAIDDMQDPEYMYIQSGTTNSVTNGNAASLRSDQTAYFEIWVGTRDSTSPIGTAASPTYSTLKVKLIGSTGAEYTASFTGMPNVSSGWRTMQSSNSTYYDSTAGHFKFSIPYANVSAAGKNITGIVMAETASS